MEYEDVALMIQWNMGYYSDRSPIYGAAEFHPCWAMMKARGWKDRFIVKLLLEDEE
jgi:hypothetical protein